MDAITTAIINFTVTPPSIKNDTLSTGKREAYFGEIYIYAIITAITLITNLIMLCFLIFVRKLHSMSNWILCSMFCTGLIYGLTYLLPRWVLFVPLKLHLSYACQILPLVGSALVVNFNLHLVLVSIDRYCCVLYPFQYNMARAPIITRCAIVFVWLISFFMASIPLFTFLVPKIGICGIQLNSRSFHIYTLVTFILLFYLPLFILCIVYTRILWIVNIHTQRRDQILARHESVPTSIVRRNLRAITYMMILIGLFMIFWLPTMIHYLVLFPTIHLGIDDRAIVIGKIVRYISLAYPAINPLLYAYFTPCIRSEIYRIFARTLCTNAYKNNRSVWPEYS